MKKRLLGILLALALLLGYVPTSFAQADIAEWSIFVYLCGSDLESNGGAAAANLAEAMRVDIPDNVNMIVQTGGSRQWRVKGIDPNKLQRLEVKRGRLKLVDEQPLASMGDAQTLGNFLTYGVQNYPAERYMVVFWDHGSGSTGGVCFDELFRHDYLSFTEMAKGLKAPGVTFDILGFDTCLMATLENMAAMAPYGKYMVASEEYEPGGGWDYEGFLRKISLNPAADTLSIAKGICDTYFEKCKRSRTESMATLSVVDLSKADPLLTAFDRMAAEMNGAAEDIDAFRNLSTAAKSAESYGGSSMREGYSNMVDLGDLTTKAKNVVSETGMDVLNALFAAVPYKVNGRNRSGANGISVFYPLGSLDKNKLAAYFTDAATSENYRHYVQAVANYSGGISADSWGGYGQAQAGGDSLMDVLSALLGEGQGMDTDALGDLGGLFGTPGSSQDDLLGGMLSWMQEDAQYEYAELPEQQDHAVQFSTYIAEDGTYGLEITGGLEAVETVRYALSYIDYDNKEFLGLGLDNDLDANWQAGLFYDNFRGVWPTIDGVLCAPALIAEEATYNLYTIPVLLNGKKAHLRAAYWFDEEQEIDGWFEVLGAWNGLDEDTGMSGRDLRKLKAGDEITFLFDGYNWETEETTTYKLDTITVEGDGVTMEESALADGDYEFYYAIGDLFGNTHYSDTIKMTSRNGEIFLKEM